MKKLSSKKIISCLLVAVFLLALTAPAMAEQKIIKVVCRDMNGKFITYETTPEELEESAWSMGAGMSDRYNTWEVVTIDGVPWQDTKYAEVIKNNLFFYYDGYIAKHPEVVEIILDKRFNGKGHIVANLIAQGKSISEIKEILLKQMEEEQTGNNKNGSSGTVTGPASKKIVVYIDKKNASYSVDGTWTNIPLDTAPVIMGGRTMVPLRGVVDALGATLEWRPATRQVLVKLDGKTVLLTIGSKKAIVNGKETMLDVPPCIANGRTLIPLRFVSEGLGLKVSWDAKNKSATIQR